MTPQEAIQVINDKVRWLPTCPDIVREALDVAIEALEKQDVLDTKVYNLNITGAEWEKAYKEFSSNNFQNQLQMARELVDGKKIENNGDLISRQAVIDLFEAYEAAALDNHIPKVLRNELKRLPSAQPRSGKWIVTSKFEDYCYAKCNQCNVTQVFYYNKPLTNFCPNCGADMRGEK